MRIQVHNAALVQNEIALIKKEGLWCVAEEVFGNHSSTSQIDLHGNPYTCDCHMMPLLDWLKSTKTRLVNKVAISTKFDIKFL